MGMWQEIFADAAISARRLRKNVPFLAPFITLQMLEKGRMVTIAANLWDYFREQPARRLVLLAPVVAAWLDQPAPPLSLY